MSETPPPPPPDEYRPPPPDPRSGCMTAFLILVGCVMLLPGLCALIFGVGTLSSSNLDPVVMVLVLFGLLVGFAGVMLIRSAIRGRGP